jgi:uncharacterized protein
MLERMLGVMALCVLQACSLGPSEADARVEIEKDGLANIEIVKKEGGTFEFSGTQGDELCEGTLTMQKGFGSSSFTKMMSCKLDTRACKKGAAKACNELADRLYGKEAKVFPTLAAELYRTACADDDAHACTRAGEFEVIGKSWDKVREFSKKGCDLKSGEACARLAATEHDGHGTAKDDAKAIELFKQACDLGAMRGCRGAAGLLIDAEPADHAGALGYADKGCKASYDDSCFVYGVVLFRLKKDYDVALKHLLWGCDSDKPTRPGLACNLAGAIYADGLGMPKDVAKALPLFEKACEKDSVDGCENAGEAYRKGVGAPRDLVKAEERFAKACTLGATDRCKK